MLQYNIALYFTMQILVVTYVLELVFNAYVVVQRCAGDGPQLVIGVFKVGLIKQVIHVEANAQLLTKLYRCGKIYQRIRR